ncbi:MAG: hypothetical protein J5689_01060 [Clostridia bacterium]|nr:hypothetical protein [Clostridia bacterium]
MSNVKIPKFKYFEDSYYLNSDIVLTEEQKDAIWQKIRKTRLNCMGLIDSTLPTPIKKDEPVLRGFFNDYSPYYSIAEYGQAFVNVLSTLSKEKDNYKEFANVMPVCDIIGGVYCLLPFQVCDNSSKIIALLAIKEELPTITEYEKNQIIDARNYINELGDYYEATYSR